jgi:hypothetical protein
MIIKMQEETKDFRHGALSSFPRREAQQKSAGRQTGHSCGNPPALLQVSPSCPHLCPTAHKTPWAVSFSSAAGCKAPLYVGLIIVHLTFVVSALLLALTDRILTTAFEAGAKAH